jgi:hypothetical protein
MEDQGHLPPASTDDGVDQSSNGDCGEAVCRDQVPGPQGSGGHWSSGPGTDLQDDTLYEVRGSTFNLMHRMAVDNFNRSLNEPSEPFSYTQAFWNGYGCAIAGLRDFARHRPVDPTVQ